MTTQHADFLRVKVGDFGMSRFSESEDNVVLPLGYGMLYNHSYDANCEYVQDGPDVITFVTRRPVAAGGSTSCTGRR